MKETVNADIAHGLARHYYLSEEIYQQELERVFKRQWLVAGHISLAKNFRYWAMKNRVQGRFLSVLITSGATATTDA